MKTPNQHKYNAIKRYIYGIMGKEDAKTLLQESENETFFEQMEIEMRDVWHHEEESANANTENAQYIYEGSKLLHQLNKPKQSIRKYILMAGSAAAVLFTLVFTISHLIDNEINPSSNIATFAIANQADISEMTETQLVISDEETILLHEKESTITYNEEGIVANKNDISKDQISTYNQLITPKGKRSILVLSDGSKAWINAGSRVIYPSKFSEKEREIYVDGEIYIEVAKESKRPFLVKTKDMNVQVLGTKFNVTAYETDASSKVVLAEGKVSVQTNQSKSGATILKPNQMLEWTNNKESISIVNPYKYTSWIDGIYTFDEEKLQTVILALTRYYGVSIECDTGVASILCTGKLDLKDNVEDILKLLSYSSPISYSKEGDKYHINRIIN